MRCSRPGRYRLLGQHRAARAGDLGEAAGDEDAVGGLALVVNLDDAGTHRRDQRRVPRQDAEVALAARHHDHVDLGRDQQPLGRHQLEGDLVSHDVPQAASAAICLAFSVASSMVPSM
jgi:hypothetical protein